MEDVFIFDRLISPEIRLALDEDKSLAGIYIFPCMKNIKIFPKQERPFRAEENSDSFNRKSDSFAHFTGYLINASKSFPPCAMISAILRRDRGTFNRDRLVPSARISRFIRGTNSSSRRSMNDN